MIQSRIYYAVRYILPVLLIALMLLFLYAGLSLAAFYIHLHRYPSPGKRCFRVPGIPDMRPYQALHINAQERWNTAEKEPLELVSYDGLKLKGLFFPAKEARGVAVLSHGYHCSAHHDFCELTAAYLDRGFHVLLFDQRGCGKSEGRYVTMGVKESRDLGAWCRLATEKAPGLPLLVHGMSMGGSTVLMGLDVLPAQVRVLVIDCAFCTPHETVGYVFSRTPVLKCRTLLPGVELWTRLLAGFSLWEKDTSVCLKNNSLPVFFTHGDADRLVPEECTHRNAAACASPHEVLILPGAGHTECYLKAREQVFAALDTFLDRYFFTKKTLQAIPHK